MPLEIELALHQQAEELGNFCSYAVRVSDMSFTNSPNLYRMLAIAPGDVTLERMQSMVPPAYYLGPERYPTRPGMARIVNECPFDLSDGRRIWVRRTLDYGEFGGEAFVIGVIIDITSAVERRARLADLNAQLQEALQLSAALTAFKLFSPED